MHDQKEIQIGKFGKMQNNTDASGYIAFLDMIENLPQAKRLRQFTYNKLNNVSGAAAINVGCESICQLSMPLAERAAHKCESPRRSSTRHNNNVVPSAKIVAPGLKTLLTRYGQSAAVRMGLCLDRVKRFGE
jgi:hypothetical protein